MTAQIINISDYLNADYPDAKRNLENMSMRELISFRERVAKERGKEMLHMGFTQRAGVLDELFENIQAEIKRRDRFIAYNGEWQRDFENTFGGGDDTAA